MQRQGGGGNDPSCGCDMRVGWPSSANTKMQKGGGCGCTAGLFKGGKRMKRSKRSTRKNRQSGGGCGCTGGVLPQMGGKRKGTRKSRYGKKSRSRK